MNRLSRLFPLLLLAPTVLPLVIAGGLYFPQLFPKVILFYALTLLSLAAFIILLSRGESFYFERLKVKVSWIPLALLLLAYLASILGIGFYKSFWSIFGRGDGLLLLTCSVISFYLILITADRLFFRHFTRTIAVVGSAVALWGIVEWLITGGRIGSSLGNPAFLAGYLAITFFITLATGTNLPRDWQRLLYCGAGLQLIAILLSATRGTLLALIVVTVVALFYNAFRGNERTRRFSAISLIALVLFAGGFFLLREKLSQSSFTPIARVAQISTSDPDIANRLFVWKHMVEEIKQKPLLGYGAEHIAYLFDTFYDPGVITEEWFDRSHNAYLDYAAQFGIGGALLYLALIITLLFSALRYAKSTPENYRAGMLYAGAALTYAVQNFFVFDTVSSWWLFLALLAVLLVQHKEVPKTAFSILHPYVGTAVALLLLILIIPTSLLPLIANYDLTRGYYYHVIDVSRANAYFKKGLALNTYGDLEYGYQLHTMYADRQASFLVGEERVAAYAMAKEVLSENYQKYPYDARTAVYLAHVLDSAPPEISVDASFVREVVVRALELSPKRAQAWYVLANLPIEEARDFPVGQAKTAKYQEAISILKGYTTIAPTLSEPYFILADLYFAIGEIQKAEESAFLGDAHYKGGLSIARRAALFYENTQNWERAAFYLQSVVDQDEEDNAFLYDLAKVEYLLGEYERALEIVKELRQRSPETLTTDPNFLSAITTYEQSR